MEVLIGVRGDEGVVVVVVVVEVVMKVCVLLPWCRWR